MFHSNILCTAVILGKVSDNLVLPFHETYEITHLEAMIFLAWIYLAFKKINESMMPWKCRALTEEGILNKNHNEKD